MQKISFPYRASSHLVFLHVVAESGAWEKHGLDVNYDFQISSKDAHRAVPTGEVEFVGGNHISTYAHRARGDNWVYVGQTANKIHTRLAVRKDSGINDVQDLRGKTLGTRGNHPGHNDWLLLKQRGLDADRGDLNFVKQVEGEISREAAEQIKDADGAGAKRKRSAVWEWVRDGKVDGALLTAPSSLFAEAAGLKVIDLEPLPMIWFTTVSSSLPFVEKHPDIVQSMLKGLLEGIHFFKTQPERSIEIIRKKYTKEGQMSLAQATIVYQVTADMLDPKMYPSMSAIMNVYEEAKRQDSDSLKVNPMELWDLGHLRKIDDSGFIKNLNASRAEKPVDPDQAAEQRKHAKKMRDEFVSDR